MKINADVSAILAERFGQDNLIALATLDADSPAVPTVNAYYEDSAFYIITYAMSAKMQQIGKNPKVAVCGDWFTARGTAESMGHILLPENASMADKLRTVFAEWYDNSHTNEADPHTIILCVRLTEGVLFHHGTRYDIEF